MSSIACPGSLCSDLFRRQVSCSLLTGIVIWASCERIYQLLSVHNSIKIRALIMSWKSLIYSLVVKGEIRLLIENLLSQIRFINCQDTNNGYVPTWFPY